MDYLGRQRSLQNELSKHRLDAFLITHLANIRYLCGFTGSAGVLLVSEDKSIFFSDGRYASQARAEVQAGRIVIQRKPPLLLAAEWLRSRFSRLSVGIEAEHLTVAGQRRLKDCLSSSFRLRLAPPVVEQARMIKDREEIEHIRKAVLLGSKLFTHLLGTIRPGMTELEAAAELESAAYRAGAPAMSFPTIIASGERSSLPHGRASNQAIPQRGFVVCDFGVILDGYCSDMTRTISVGHPTLEARRVYQAVREAQQAATDAVQAGRTVGEIDGVARKSLEKNKLGKYFSHSTGHGVGLEIHEAPHLAAGQKEVLRPGMVITIEPGVYLAGKFGVRIEDMVVVNERGCEVLTSASKDLIAL
jgi:Xaa-Pro aminopeptidase